MDDLESNDKTGVNKLIEAFKHTRGDLGLNWDDETDKPSEEHIPVSQTENDDRNKLQTESTETTNMNVNQVDKDDNEGRGRY